MSKSYYVDFNGSLKIVVPDGSKIEDVEVAFFQYLNGLNATNVPQFQFCEIENVEPVTVPPLYIHRHPDGTIG